MRSTRGPIGRLLSLDAAGLVPVANLPIDVTTLTLTGIGAPSSLLGLDGDYYINATTGELWGPKAAGAWPATFVDRASGKYGAYESVFQTGRWYPGCSGTGTALLMSANLGYANLMAVNTSHTFTAIGLNITIAGTGGTLRFGIYTDNGSGYPATLVADCGTVAATGTGATQIAISQALPVGLYWLVAVGQGGSVQPTVTTVNSVHNLLWFGSSAAGGASGTNGLGVAALSAGALPGTYTAGATLLGANSLPLVQIKA